MPKRRLSRQARAVLILWLIGTVIGEALVVNLHRLLPGLLPPVASDLARSTNLTLGVFTILSVPVAMGVFAVAVYTVATSRTREFPEGEGPAIHGNAWAQGAWLAGSSVLCVGLVVWGLALMPPIYTPRPGNNLVVDVTGQQWQWTFSYPGEGNLTSTTLVLPAGEPVTFRVTSVDVTHSFWVPALSVKVDANNGEITTAYVRPDRVGTYTVECVELCGLYHAYMQAPVKIVSQAQFYSWVGAQQQGAA